ncbi:MAG: associated domain protein [Candidatus Eremiobacteraeota bacterium]|nr:associated domain protein [Candidatus Eremiobacteraeota bacterium]
MSSRSCREHDPRRDGAGPVAGAADALQRRRHPARAAQHDDAVDVADVDAQLERRRAHHRAQPPAPQLGLGAMAGVALERAMVHADPPVACRRLGARAVLGDGDLLGRLARQCHLVGHPLGLAAHVGEHQRRADVLGEAVRGAGALRQRRHRAGERRDDVEPHLAQPAAVDDRAVALGSGEVTRDPLERRDRRRQPDAPQRGARQLGERFEQEREVRAALAPGQRVDFVDDDRLDVRERLAIGVHRDHQREGLGGREQHVRRAAHHQPPLLHRRVTGPHAGPHEGLADPPAPPPRALGVRPFEDPHLAHRSPQVVLDVVAERAQGRDVQAVRAGEQLVGVAQVRQPRDDRQERRQRLPRPGRGADQAMARAGRQRERLGLRRGRRAEMLVAPPRDVGVQRGKRVVHENGARSSNARSSPGPGRG